MIQPTLCAIIQWSRQTLCTTLGKALAAGIIMAVLGLGAHAVSARLHSGQVTLLPGDGWDFSDSTYGTFSTYDIVYDVTTATHPTRVFMREPESISDMVHAFIGMTYIGYADSVYEKLEQAPTDPAVYESNWSIFPGEVYAIRTREGHYAKLSIVNAGGLFKFNYTYQDDGSPSFLPPVRTQPVTWGRVKALFR